MTPGDGWTTLHGWGGVNPSPGFVITPRTAPETRAAVAACPLGSRGMIARGMGRSYGDAAQLAGGHVLAMSRLDDIELDARAGTVVAGAGTTIGALLGACVPGGWMVPVVPGTQHVSVGGAIASDVHGKNHKAHGSFGDHVDSLTLLRSDGEVRTLDRTREARTLAATIGGMGLTGVVLAARLRLAPIESALMEVDTDRTTSLDQALALLVEAPANRRYAIAWLDLLGRPGDETRAVVSRSDHAPAGAGMGDAGVRARFEVPSWWPGGLLRRAGVRAFNRAFYRRAPARERGRVEPLGRHLFPLDALGAWPRLYGADGLVQYQLALPRGAESVLDEVIGRVRRSPAPCFLATLKRLGSPGTGMLSFPIDGWTLALDLPRRAPELEALLRGLDELVAGAGGRVYLTKDSRLQSGATAAMYPLLPAWREAREEADPRGLWRSDLALRTGLIEAA